MKVVDIFPNEFKNRRLGFELQTIKPFDLVRAAMNRPQLVAVRQWSARTLLIRFHREK